MAKYLESVGMFPWEDLLEYRRCVEPRSERHLVVAEKNVEPESRYR